MTTSVLAPLRWRIIGTTVRGASHTDLRLPNQDAIAWQCCDASEAIAVLAVSDGHGSPKCFRSDRGAHFAAQVAIEVLTEFGRSMTANFAPLIADAQVRLARELSEAWNRRVERDLREHPVARRERAIAADPFEAYGATMLAVLLAPAFVLFVQIGDGDILLVGEDGATRRVFKKDRSLAVNETDSLIQFDAWKQFRFELLALSAMVPELIIVSTDGYGNSFASDADFLQIGGDFQKMIRNDGVDAIAGQLATILSDTSTAGSRDDVTLGIVTRLRAEELHTAVMRASAPPLLSLDTASENAAPEPKARAASAIPWSADDRNERTDATRADIHHSNGQSSAQKEAQESFALAAMPPPASDPQPQERQSFQRHLVRALRWGAPAIVFVVAVFVAIFSLRLRPQDLGPPPEDALTAGDRVVESQPQQAQRDYGESAEANSSRAARLWRHESYAFAKQKLWAQAGRAATVALALDQTLNDDRDGVKNRDFAYDLVSRSLSELKSGRQNEARQDADRVFSVVSAADQSSLLACKIVSSKKAAAVATIMPLPPPDLAGAKIERSPAPRATERRWTTSAIAYSAARAVVKPCR